MIYNKNFLIFLVGSILFLFLTGCVTIPDDYDVGPINPGLDDSVPSDDVPGDDVPGDDVPGDDSVDVFEGTPVIIGVSASDYEVTSSMTNSPDKTIDKNYADGSRWSAEGLQWIMYEFEKVTRINEVSILFLHSARRVYDFSLEYSQDNVSWTKIDDFKSSSLDWFETFSFNPVDAKYLRYNGKFNDESNWNSLIEVTFDEIPIKEVPSPQPPVKSDPDPSPPIKSDPVKPSTPIELDMDKFCGANTFVPKNLFNLKLKSASDYQKIVYIDPSHKGSGDGSSPSSPLKSWGEISSLQANTAYLQKRGTEDVINKRFTLLKVDNVLIGAYGTGAKPYLKTTSSMSGDNSLFLVSASDGFTIRDIKLSSPGLASVVRLGSHYSTRSTNAMVYNLTIEDTRFNGIRCFGVDRLKILHTHIENIPDDGIICQRVDLIEVAYNTIVRINTNWKPPETHQNDAGGDSLQFSRVTNWYVHNNFFDRSDSGNKFAFISNTEGHNGLAECNVMKGPIRTSQGGAVIYIGGGQNNVVIRYNRLMGPSLGALYAHSVVSFHDNILQGDGVSSLYCNSRYDLVGCDIRNNIIIP